MFTRNSQNKRHQSSLKGGLKRKLKGQTIPVMMMPTAILSSNSKKVLYALFLTVVFTTPVKGVFSDFNWPCGQIRGWRKVPSLNRRGHIMKPVYCKNQKKSPNFPMCNLCLKKKKELEKKELEEDREAERRSKAYRKLAKKSKNAFRKYQQSIKDKWSEGTYIWVHLENFHPSLKKKLLNDEQYYVFGTGKISRKPKEQKCTQTGVKLYHVEVELDVYYPDGRGINKNAKKVKAVFPVGDTEYIELVDEESIEQKRLDAVKIGSGMLERVEVKDLDGHYNDHDDDMSDELDVVQTLSQIQKELGIDLTGILDGNSDDKAVAIDDVAGTGSIPDLPESTDSKRRRMLMLVNRLIAAEMN